MGSVSFFIIILSTISFYLLLSLKRLPLFMVKQVMLELAQLYLTLDDVEACQQQCSVILKNDPVNEAATLVSLSIIPLCLLDFFVESTS